ncbi:hypothetical protein OHB12_03655 [Nocardia sp. NBC_01730]|uniref:hypothetical protein n=1 Tax=Nocardia sp. NBC_01730 TaxID=2975998 RepID=UPI002E0F6013|nr:hypothetical protein OHB12_03655 [Nocardia sp. NBC_01730]
MPRSNFGPNAPSRRCLLTSSESSGPSPNGTSSTARRQALIRTALSTAYLGGAQILYGQFLSKNRGLADFYRQQRFTLMLPGMPLDFSTWMGLSAGPAPLADEWFCCRDVTRGGKWRCSRVVKWRISDCGQVVPMTRVLRAVSTTSAVMVWSSLIFMMR